MGSNKKRVNKLFWSELAPAWLIAIIMAIISKVIGLMAINGSIAIFPENMSILGFIISSTMALLLFPLVYLTMITPIIIILHITKRDDIIIKWLTPQA